MTVREKIIVSAYTSVLMIEEKLGHPVWAHELADKDVWNEIKRAVKPDFMALC